MPGPMSAPNGNVFLTLKARDGSKVKTGKTDLKRGKIKHATKESEIRKLSRARRQQQEED